MLFADQPQHTSSTGAPAATCWIVTVGTTPGGHRGAQAEPARDKAAAETGGPISWVGRQTPPTRGSRLGMCHHSSPSEQHSEPPAMEPSVLAAGPQARAQVSTTPQQLGE